MLAALYSTAYSLWHIRNVTSLNLFNIARDRHTACVRSTVVIARNNKEDTASHGYCAGSSLGLLVQRKDREWCRRPIILALISDLGVSFNSSKDLPLRTLSSLDQCLRTPWRLEATFPPHLPFNHSPLPLLEGRSKNLNSALLHVRCSAF